MTNQLPPPRAVEPDESLHDEKRRRVVEAAAEVFAERGFVAGTTKEIAGRLGLSQPAIYHYVGSKDVLLEEIALQVANDMKRTLAIALDGDDEPLEQIRALLQEFVAAVIANRSTFIVYYQERHSLRPDLRQQIVDDERNFVRSVEHLVIRLQDRGQLPGGPSALVLTEALLGMVSWIPRWYQPSGRLNAKDIADQMMQLIGLGWQQSD